MLVVDNIVDNMALGSLVMARGRVGKTGAGEQKSCTNFIHYRVFLPTFLLREALMMAGGRVGKTGAGEQKSCTNFIHYGVFLPTFLLREELKQTAPWGQGWQDWR